MFRPPLTLTSSNAKTVLEAGLHAIRSGQSTIDMAGVTTVDSAAVATLLAWQRAARREGRTLTFVNLPDSLRNLSQLYGVIDLLHVPAAAQVHADLHHH